MQGIRKEIWYTNEKSHGYRKTTLSVPTVMYLFIWPKKAALR